MSLQVVAIPARQDNYIWLLRSPQNNQVAVVDPSDAEPVQAYLKQHQLTLSHILITHHHHDHTHGIAALKQDNEQLIVIGPQNSSIAGITHPVTESDALELFELPLKVIEVPGHTLDHLAYVIEHKLFSGDTLFSAGCGRLFEGSAAQMFNSLNKIAILPEDTQVYCAHEYTLSNLNFAQQVEPDNLVLHDYLALCQQLRKLGQPTLPSSIAIEKQINPFLRTAETSVQQRLKETFHQEFHDEIDYFTQLRKWKDNN